MQYCLKSGGFHEGDLTNFKRVFTQSDSGPSLFMLSKQEISACYSSFGIKKRLLEEFLQGNAMKFESHEGFDYISLAIPDKEDPSAVKYPLFVYFRENLLVFCCDEPTAFPALRETRLLVEMEIEETGRLSLEKALQFFFDTLTSQDISILEEIEDQATQMEELLIIAKVRDYVPEIVKLRKKLLAYQHYYGRLSSISSSIEENDNDLLSEKELRYFRILTNRTIQLLDGVNNLHNYVSQVREAYQTQVDINQNKIMKLFTVITAIFLPLTLLVGWYGMNLMMPEYHWIYGYPFVIAISVIVSLLGILYFKRNKWF